MSHRKKLHVCFNPYELFNYLVIYREFKAHLYEMNINLAANGSNIHEANHCIEAFRKQIESLEVENQVTYFVN